MSDYATLEGRIENREIIILDGAAHRHMRRLLMPPFHGERMRAYGDAVRRATRLSIREWPRGRPFRIHDELRRITLEVILRAVLGLENDPDTVKGRRFYVGRYSANTQMGPAGEAA